MADTLTNALNNNVSIVYKKAAVNKPVLDGLLNRVAQKSSARPITNFKNPQTAVKKVDEKNEEDPKRGYELQDVNDIARGRLVYNSLDAMRKGVQTLKDQLKQTPGVTIAKEQDFFQHPEGGYRGYHVDLAFPNGQHSEIQLHTPQSLANSLATHQMHAQYGDEPPANIEDQKEEVGNQMMKLPNDVSNQISQTVEAQNAPQMQQAQQAAQQVVQSPVQFDIPKMTMQPPANAAFPPSKGGMGMSKSPATPAMIQKAVSYLKGNLNKDDIKTIGSFAQKIEEGKGKSNLGELGKTMQSMTEDAFGKQAGNWSNKQIKDAWDMVVQGVQNG